MYPIITDTASLEALCARLSQESFVTVDTEFMRERTYYPQLCLIQIAGAHEAAAIDPLAIDIDLTSLYALLRNRAVLKVFHACRQDVEIFYQAMGELPCPIFDTQIAAMVCGFGESVGYETLVNKLLGKSVDKSSRFTDWSKRPLSDKQVDYAIHDVLYLRGVYTAMLEKLQASGRAAWIEDEMRPMMDPKTYEVDADEVWRKIRLRNTSQRSLALLQAAARWRELTARARNVPRSRIMKDDTLAEVALSKSKSFADLQAVRGFYPTLQVAHYEPLFVALRDAEQLPPSECPRLPAKEIMPEGAEAVADLLRLLLKSCAARHQVVPRLIADKDDLDALAVGKREHIATLSGWRNELFGKQALQLLEGGTAIKVDGKNGITFVDIA